MPAPFIAQAVIWEDGGATFLARVVNNDGTYVTQAALTTISWEVYDRHAGGTAVATGTCAKATCIFDTLQKDGRWKVDEQGYNFRYAMAASSFPDARITYQVEFVFDPATGEDYPGAVYRVTTKELMGS